MAPYRKGKDNYSINENERVGEVGERAKVNSLYISVKSKGRQESRGNRSVK